MPELFLQKFDPTKVDEPYENDMEYFEDFTRLLDVKLYYLYKYHPRVGPKNVQNLMGVVVSREEFEEKLGRNTEMYCGSALSQSEVEDITLAYEHVTLRKIASIRDGKFLSIPFLAYMFSLTDFEEDLITLCYICELDRKYEKIFGYLQDDVTRKLPCIELAIKLFAPVGSMIADYLKYFNSNQMLPKYFFQMKDTPETTALSRTLKLDSRVIDYITNPRQTSINLPGCMELFDASSDLHPLYIHEGIQTYLRKLVRRQLEDQEQELEVQEPEDWDEGEKNQASSLGDQPLKIINLHGPDGAGKRFQVKHAAKWMKTNCLFVDAKSWMEENDIFQKAYRELIRESVLNQSFICLYNFDAIAEMENSQALMNEMFTELADFSQWVFVLTKNEIKYSGHPENIVLIEVPVTVPDDNSRFILWKKFLEGVAIQDDIQCAELSGKFKFTPGQVQKSIQHARSISCLEGQEAISAETLHKCCYKQVVNKLSELASSIRPAHDWSSLVLPKDQIENLKSACNHIKHRYRVFSEWGFDKKITYGTGLSMLFSGPPGTGKTMAAQVIANQLHMEMYKIQLSQIVSKYIGETEKNLKRVFDEAKASNSILFFDETDALFGKRSEVKDSHDRYANIETAYLLQQVEEHDGVIIMATNYLQNIDNAFMRRIHYVIHFPFPDKAARKGIWQTLIPRNVPLDPHVDFDFLADKFEVSGGHIKNIILQAAFMAADEESCLGMKHFIKSAVHELKKINLVIVKENLEEYADLI